MSLDLTEEKKQLQKKGLYLMYNEIKTLRINICTVGLHQALLSVKVLITYQIDDDNNTCIPALSTQTYTKIKSYSIGQS